MFGKTLEQEREKLNLIRLDDPRILEQSRKVDKLLLEEIRKQKTRQPQGHSMKKAWIPPATTGKQQA